jgi:hypothetical protein
MVVLALLRYGCILYTGPNLLNIDDEGYPLQPYGIKENPYSILDVADIVL